MLGGVHAFTGTLLRVERDEELQSLVSFTVIPDDIRSCVEGLQGSGRQRLFPDRRPPQDAGIDLFQRKNERLRDTPGSQTAGGKRADQERRCTRKPG